MRSFTSFAIVASTLLASAAAQDQQVANAMPTQAPSPEYMPGYDYQKAMPYSSMVNGGYQQLDCGYGWYKGSDGKCAKQTWVRLFH